MPDPETREMQIVQSDKEEAERDLADTSTQDAETDAHTRRADKAAYLKAKLEERGRAEDEAG
jgi:hypothetical protein